jgi:APA family basic amino acid/polyamine antiporter
MSSDNDNFKRSLGLAHLTASGVGVIIGAGIYVLIGPATQRAGGMVWASMLLASALCALTAFSYMELTSMFPKAGSEHEFARQVFPDWISFTTGWGMAVALVVAAAAVSLGFARYLREFVDVNEHVASLGLLVAVGALAFSGMQKAKWLVIFLSIVQVGGLIAVIVIGAHHIGDVSLTTGHGFSGVIAGSSVIFFAYIGFDEVITLAEETKDPHRTVPRALLLALVMSTILYVLVAIVAVSVLGSAALAISTHPLTDVMRESLGGVSVQIIGVVALATTANTTLLATTAAARMIYSMGDNGVIPARWAQVHDKQSPRVATVAALICAGALSVAGGLEILASATNALVYLMFLVVNVVVIILRKQQPHAPRPFRISFSLGWVPVIPCLGIVATLALSMQLEIRPVLAALGLLGSGLLMYAINRLRS